MPPVDELDLVGPLQVFNSVNRLAGRTIYTIEVVTTASGLKVEGEGGIMTFMARQHFSKVKGACDSVLLVCGLGTRTVRDAALSAWLTKTAGEVRRLGAVCVGSFLLAEAGLLNGRRATTHWRFGREFAARHPRRARRARAAVGQGRKHLHVGRRVREHRSRARVGRGGLRRGARARSGARARAVPAPAGRTSRR